MNSYYNIKERDIFVEDVRGPCYRRHMLLEKPVIKLVLQIGEHHCPTHGTMEIPYTYVGRVYT